MFLSKFHFWALSLVFLLASARGVMARELSYSEINQRVSPAVVMVVATDIDGNVISMGSGFIVHRDGLVVSNYHVIRGSYRAAVKLKSGDIYEVRGVAEFDPQRDFAILKVNGYGLPTVSLGNSDYVEIGEDVVAIGNPQGLEHTVSNGIVSQLRDEGGYRMLQITAPISQGSSGGPLVDRSGQVIGIVTATYREGQNLNFALPINYIRGKLGSNTSVKYHLTEIADWQAEQDEKILVNTIAEMFELYQDPDNYFSMVYPKTWRVQHWSGWDDGRTTFHKMVMMAPYEAHRAELNGYLSEGIRIHFQVVPEGKVWTMSSVDEWGPIYIQDVLEGNPGFVLTEESTITFGNERAKVYSIVGQNANIPEPEKSTFIVVANQYYRLTIELVSPTSKLQDYEIIYRALISTFAFS